MFKQTMSNKLLYGYYSQQSDNEGFPTCLYENLDGGAPIKVSFVSSINPPYSGWTDAIYVGQVGNPLLVGYKECKRVSYYPRSLPSITNFFTCLDNLSTHSFKKPLLVEKISNLLPVDNPQNAKIKNLQKCKQDIELIIKYIMNQTNATRDQIIKAIVSINVN